ncbi:hypothetical protein [Owenweeksia hongkongensis]|uniref:Nmad2 family putative nucleotide modification protein n=1 Tax=Owenweeksia hongkongensis TaxID=253245 RepID=UPI003A8D2C55
MYFSYKVEHDFGLAPNPFGAYCTLAVCRGQIRGSKRLKLGDWIIGTGSKALEKVSGKESLHHLVFAMKVEEVINFNDYWNDERFQYKKPIVNGSLVKMYGDNFYHRDTESQKWIQENSAHSLADGSCNKDHLERDTNSENVLISQNFFYFGNQAPLIPEELWEVCSEGRNVKSVGIPEDKAEALIIWLSENFKYGVNGDPINWKLHL